jgi:carboxylesterase
VIVSIQPHNGVTCQCEQRCDNELGVDRVREFDLVGDGELGVVLVHGFTGTPFEMRFLGEELAHAGFHVHGTLLPGHGTRVEDLDETTWHDWADAVEDSFDALSLVCRRVAVVGQSLGGLLALHLASRRPDVGAVGALATPLWLEGMSARVARWAASGALSRIRSIPKLYGSDCRDRKTRRQNPAYGAIPTRALAQLAEYMQVTCDALDRVKAPVLVLHATHDHTAPVACAARIAERTHAVRIRILPRSYHLIAADVERDIVAAEVREFLRHHLGERPACAT